MPSKLFSYGHRQAALHHLAVTDTDPTRHLAKYPLALVLHKKKRLTPEVVDTLRRWLWTDVQGSACAYPPGGRPHPEFTE